VSLRIGTSSWKYDSWEGLVYEPGSRSSYLEQYARRFDTVEIDQWFWRLPDPATAAEYAASVPESFRFTIKVPNLITLTHPYARRRGEPLEPNPTFLSAELFAEFLQAIRPLAGRIGALIFQFEYLNRQKMPSQARFLELLDAFFGRLPAGAPPFVLEPRNPRWLDGAWFGFLRSRGLGHCFLQGYYMPPIAGLYAEWGAQLVGSAPVVLRLHGPDRAGMERASGGRWDRIVEPRDGELEEIVQMSSRLLANGFEVYLNVNNHFEGSAPLTIEKLQRRLSELRDRRAG
jgi:uncharacterized protein YecE (DUF72 family)